MNKEDLIIQFKIWCNEPVAPYETYLKDMEENFPDCEVLEEQVMFYDPIDKMFQGISEIKFNSKTIEKEILSDLLDSDNIEYEVKDNVHTIIEKDVDYEDDIVIQVSSSSLHGVLMDYFLESNKTADSFEEVYRN